LYQALYKHVVYVEKKAHVACAITNREVKFTFYLKNI